GDGTTQMQSNMCTLTDHTTATSSVAPSGCAILDRDVSACKDARTGQGISGYWLKFSCRVTLSMASGGQYISAQSDGQPDYKSNYFPTSNACYEAYSGGLQNPNTLSAKNYSIQFPKTPDMTPQSMVGMNPVVGLALNGVPIFGDFAAPGDDI